ncbi:hypothetical protein QQZ08_004507 [Neonectria magnoliae]|uniref:Uncharacterized protein n=1 Tax=Neonectria magnoliae TaxID=2732573 RepID=A0ABR1I5P8_9HYPO
MAPARKVTGPSNFCEWVIGTTIPSALGPIPSKKKPRRRDVVRVEITTDDESEEDTLKITYPRTGRNKQTSQNPGPAIKKVRFDENTKDAPKKSALKKQKPPATDSDDTSDSTADATPDSSQSSKAGDSEADSSDDAPKPAKSKKQHHKSKSSSDTDIEYDSDPHPTCKCQSCAKGRDMLGKLGKKGGKSDSDGNTETSESEADHSPAKGKKKAATNGKKNGGKKNTESSSEGETSNSSKETSESEPEKPAKAKAQAKTTAAKKKDELKSEESETDAEASESEPDPPPKAKKQEPARSNKAKGGKQTESSDADGETSESAKDTEEETKPAKKNNSNKNKPDSGKKNSQQNRQKQAQKQPQKQKKEPESEATDQDEDEEEEKTSGKEKDKSKKTKQSEETEKATSKKSKNKDGAKKGNYPEAMPLPNPRRPNLIEPIRAEVVQTERVVETPEDPPPNAYYDQEHNIVRVYYGPVYGNHHGNALYPTRTTNNQPLPMGIPHPTQNTYFYGFNNQHPPQQPPQPPQGYGYNHVPITQGMPPGPWTTMAPPPGYPPGPPGQPVAQLDGQQMKPDGGMYVMSGGAGFPPSSKDKDKDGLNNIGPEDFKDKPNPYLPKRAKSQFSSYGRHASKETRHSGKDGAHPHSNQGWSSHDGPRDQQSKWGGSVPNDEWNQTRDSQQGQNEWGGSAQHSQKSNDSARRKQGEHWGSDTWPKSHYSPKDWGTTIPEDQNGQGSNSNATAWGQDRPGDSTANSNPPNNVMPGSWVETAAPTPAWGDPSAAVDTQGKYGGDVGPQW